jgi:hypothetical protein
MRHPSSFRDPGSHVSLVGNEVQRVFDDANWKNWKDFEATGLAAKWTEKGHLVGYEELGERTLRLKPLPFISYPYEWTFEQLKQAALLTIDLQLRALKKGFSLKDATAFNIQFVDSQPIFIDHGSLEKYTEGTPWIAYPQFIKHFFAPLMISAKISHELTLQLLGLEGIDLKIASQILGKRWLTSPAILTHIISQIPKATEGSESAGRSVKISKANLEALLLSLKSATQKIKLPGAEGHWDNYYAETNYTDEANAFKREAVKRVIQSWGSEKIVDLGANAGDYSLVAAHYCPNVVAVEQSPTTIARLFSQSPKGIQCLVGDYCKPTPGLGPNNAERASLLHRLRGYDFLALALIHHLAISGQMPLDLIVDQMATFGNRGIVEWIEPDDSYFIRLTASRQDHVSRYTKTEFENALAKHFVTTEIIPIKDSKRILYIIQIKDAS